MGKRLKFVLQIKLMFFNHPNSVRGNHHIIHTHTHRHTPFSQQITILKVNAGVIIKTVTEQGS